MEKMAIVEDENIDENPCPAQCAGRLCKTICIDSGEEIHLTSLSCGEMCCTILNCGEMPSMEQGQTSLLAMDIPIVEIGLTSLSSLEIGQTSLLAMELPSVEMGRTSLHTVYLHGGEMGETSLHCVEMEQTSLLALSLYLFIYNPCTTM